MVLRTVADLPEDRQGRWPQGERGPQDEVGPQGRRVRYDEDGSPMGHTVAGDDMVVAECALPGTGAMVKARAELSLP